MMFLFAASLALFSILVEGRRQYEFGRPVLRKSVHHSRRLVLNLDAPKIERNRVRQNGNALSQEDVFRDLTSKSMSYSYSLSTKKDELAVGGPFNSTADAPTSTLLSRSSVSVEESSVAAATKVPKAVGIGLGVAGAVVLLVSAAVLFARNRYKKKFAPCSVDMNSLDGAPSMDDIAKAV